MGYVDVLRSGDDTENNDDDNSDNFQKEVVVDLKEVL